MNKLSSLDGSSPKLAAQRQVSRPRGVTLLTCLVLFFAVLQLTRFQQSLSRWEYLRDILPFNPVYLVINGGFWGAVGLILIGAIWYPKNWAPGLMTIVILFYSLNYWIERIILAGNLTRNINWPFVAVLNLSILVFVFWQLRRDKVKNYFGDMHD